MFVRAAKYINVRCSTIKKKFDTMSDLPSEFSRTENTKRYTIIPDVSNERKVIVLANGQAMSGGEAVHRLS